MAEQMIYDYEWIKSFNDNLDERIEQHIWDGSADS